MRFRVFYSVLTVGLLLVADLALACPRVGGLIDYNCDLISKLGFTGDSIVYGVGDTRNDNQGEGGYVGRLRGDFPQSEINNIGVPGVTSRRLFSGFKRHLRKQRDGRTKRKTKFSDFILISVGVNDYWEEGRPAFVVRNIRRLVKLLRRELEKDLGVPPIIAVATLTPTLRSFQQPFVAEVNRLLLRYRSKTLPIAIRFDQMSPSLISDDGLHPNSAGYEEMERLVQRYISKKLQAKFAAKRTDLDRDGIYDIFESERFGTDPLVEDTDGDGLADGLEVFNYLTDPLEPDTDGDGASDLQETIAGTNPLDPLDF